MQVMKDKKHEGELDNSTSSLATTNREIVKSGEKGFAEYLRQIQQFPMLTAEEEFTFGVKFSKDGDKKAAQALVQSHLRLVVKIASKFKNYGLPLTDLVSEGNLGLIQAVKKFDPYKGFRLSTYAMWWIKAYIQEYILKSWSLVKIGTTAAQKKLFFNLHKIKKKLVNIDDDNSKLSQENIEIIAKNLNVSQKEVIEMNSRLYQADSSLNVLVGDDDSSLEAGDLIVDDKPSQEKLSIDNQEKSRQKALFYKAFHNLNERERDVLFSRQIAENPLTLEELSKIHNVSRERIRQIEEAAINKIRKEINNSQN